MNYNILDKKIITVWRIIRFIRLIIITLILGIPTLILSQEDFFGLFAPYAYAAEGLIFAYMIITPFVYPAIEYRQWGYIISEDRVEIKHGIFFIHTTVIPVIRIQHITIRQGPVARKYGLSNVSIHTASGLFAIEGLINEDARAIAEALKAKLYTRLEAQDNV
jgi:uncharacterized protein